MLPGAGCVLVGANGHGKTSLIEAVVYGELFRSFRGAADREITGFGADGFHLEVEVGRQAAGGTGGQASAGQVRRVAVGYDARTRAKRVRVDGVEPDRMAEAIGIVRGVVLSPGDVGLVAGGPKERRRYLDVLLALTHRGYLEALTRYRRALAQRARSGPGEAAAFEDVLAACGAAIVAARASWADRWGGAYADHCAAVGERASAKLTYQPRTDGDAGALRAAFERSRARDRELGQTTVGPHRDELHLTLDGRDLRTYGSAGQQRTAALALRLVEAATMTDRGEAPLLCLDDAFAELDEERSRQLGALVGRLAAAGSQVLAAVPKDGEAPEAVAALRRWTIRDGRIQDG